MPVRTPPLYLAAVASGAATLLYQFVWLRLLTLSVGATWPAMAVVLSGFMAGLGIGGVLAGRRVDQDPDPRRSARRYALVELAAPVAAAAFWGLAEAVAWVPEAEVGVVPLRAIAAGLALLLPTTVFGLTFPFLSAAVFRRDGAHLPPLYAANTAGALVGAVLGALVLPYAIGLGGTALVAGMLNLVAAGLAGAGLGRPSGAAAPGTPGTAQTTTAAASAAQPGAGPGSGSAAAGSGYAPAGSGSASPAVAPSTTSRPPASPVLPGALLLLLAGGSGLLTTLGELFWTRTLFQLDARLYQDLYLQPLDMFGVVLALLLLGQCLGAVWVSRWSGPTPALLGRLGLTFVAGGALSLLGLEGVAVRTVDAVAGESVLWRVGLRLGGLLPAVVLLGVSFPLLTRLFAGLREAHGERLGRVWAVNTAGAVLGSVAGGAVVLGTLGSGGGLVLTAGLGLALGVAALAGAGRARLALGVGGVAAAGVAALVATVPLGPGLALAASRGEIILDTWEGWEATTVVVGHEGRAEGIASNGRYIQGRTGFRTRLDLLEKLSPSPKEVLLVGFGTGWLARGVLETLSPGRLTIVEIDGAQFAATRWFDTEELLRDRRVERVVDDALHYLAVTDRRFDLVIIDAWGPDQAPLLYTLDLHRRAAARVTPEGVLSAKLTPLDEAGMGAVLAAAACAWPHAWLDRAAPPSLVAGMRPVEGIPTLQAATCGEVRPLSVAWPVRLLPPFRADPGARPRPPAGPPAAAPGPSGAAPGPRPGAPGAPPAAAPGPHPGAAPVPPPAP